MKKISTIFLVFLMVLSIAVIPASAEKSPQSVSYYSIETSVRGSGQVSCDTNKIEVDSGYTCTFKATEISEKFVFWNITGDYDIVSGDYEELVFTIRPKSDIVAIATFDDGVLEHAIPAGNDSMKSPETRDNTLIFFGILVLLILICVVIFIPKK